jgi:hypothetical protein
MFFQEGKRATECFVKRTKNAMGKSEGANLKKSNTKAAHLLTHPLYKPSEVPGSTALRSHLIHSALSY